MKEFWSFWGGAYFVAVVAHDDLTQAFYGFCIALLAALTSLIPVGIMVLRDWLKRHEGIHEQKPKNDDTQT